MLNEKCFCSEKFMYKYYTLHLASIVYDDGCVDMLTLETRETYFL